jgi:hypothetical protein
MLIDPISQQLRLSLLQRDRFGNRWIPELPVEFGNQRAEASSLMNHSVAIALLRRPMAIPRGRGRRDHRRHRSGRR